MIRILLRRFSGGLRRLKDFISMLIGSRQEVGFTTTLPMDAAQDIGNYRGVRMSDVGNIVDVVDRCSDVKPLFHISLLLPQRSEASRVLSVPFSNWTVTV